MMFDYSEMPVYIMHMDETGDIPVTNNTITPTENGFTLNGKNYLDETKVEAQIAQAKSELQSWANGQFQPKSE